MLQSDLLSILRCPDDGSALLGANHELLKRINLAIHDGRLLNRAGKFVENKIENGLVRADGAYLYPIVDGIPVLLRDDAIPLDQLGD